MGKYHLIELFWELDKIIIIKAFSTTSQMEQILIKMNR